MSGFRLWEIDGMLRDAIEAAEVSIDADSGEIPEDWAEFLDAVQMERDKKCLAVAAYMRECIGEADAIKAEAKRLIIRSRTAENMAERMKAYLSSVVKVGEKLKDERIAIGWRKSSAVVVDDETALPETCFRVIRELSKSTVKDMLQKGEIKTGAHIEERQNIQVR